MTADIAALRGLYRKPDAEGLRRDLANQADAIAAAIAEAANRPTAERVEQLAIRLDAVRRLALTYRAELLAGGGPNAAA